MKPRYFNSEEEARELLNGKTYGEIREILHPYHCDDHYRTAFDTDIEEWILIPDDVVCEVDTLKYKGVYGGPQYYDQIAFNLNGKKCYKQFQFFILPENVKTITITGIA